MNVPFVNLKAHHRSIEGELGEAVSRVFRNASFIQGPEVQAFENSFAQYLASECCIAVNSGTAALHLTLLSLGVGSGHEVITVPSTFIATAEAISAVGARPVFVDVDPDSYTMDPALVESAITERTRAILPVHLYGHPADLVPLLELARRYDLAVVEDACQSHGAVYKGRKAGTLGKAGCFSFYPSKNLGGCGEGGAIVTDDPDLARQLRMLRDHGSIRKYEHSFPGYNFRMEGIQGAVLSLKLKYLNLWNEQRRARAAQYNRRLAGSKLTLPSEAPHVRHVYHLYVIQVEDRERLRQQLNQAGIETGLHYPVPLHLQQAYQSLGYRAGNFPVSERLAQRSLSLPMYPELSEEAVDYVSAVLLESIQSPIEESTKAVR